MNSYVIKLKHILPAYLISIWGTVIGLVIIRYFLSIHFQLLEINEMIWEFWIPFIFPAFPVLFLMRPKFRILSFKKAGKERTFFPVICYAVMVAMLVLSQNYLTTATGKLERLRVIQDISKKKKVRYYKIQQFEVAPFYGGVYEDIAVSGKHDEHLDVSFFFVLPILADFSNKVVEVPKNWYGVKFKAQFDNRATMAEKDTFYRNYYKTCITNLENYQFHHLDHFERLPLSDDKINFFKAIETRTKYPPGSDFSVLVPVTERYEDRNGDNLPWVFGSFAIGLAVLLFALIWPGVNKYEYEQQLKGIKPKNDELIAVLNYLIPKDGHFVTSILINLNILVFLIMAFAGVGIVSRGGLELLYWGGNRRTETINGDWWRLLTSMFLHGGIMHLLLNIYGLVVAAFFIESRLSRMKYAILYILSGIFGSLASIWWYTDTISVGASGAIFGLYGAIFGMLLTNAFKKDEKLAVLIFTGVFVVSNIVWGMAGGVDNAAHIGGLVSGAVIGWLLYKDQESNKY